MVSTASSEWLRGLTNLVDHGEDIAPRGNRTRELLHQTFIVDMNHPVVVCPSRKLNYRFMAAEAYWILTGDDTVSGIVPYNSHIAAFSDDGKKFQGAYGPRIKEQFDWVLQKLVQDHNTRQAGLVIWKDSPAPSKDIPCTVTIWFSIRNGKLNVHVFMRSSDIWLGLPYDIFNFSMLGWLMLGRFNEATGGSISGGHLIAGSLYLTAMSSHLYETSFDAADLIVNEDRPIRPQYWVPAHYAVEPDGLIALLKDLREKEYSVRRWW